MRRLSRKQIAELVNEAKYDEVGLWLIIGKIRLELGVSEPAELMDVTLQAVKDLLESGEVVAGEYECADDGSVYFHRWGPDSEQIAQRIQEKWCALGREPDIGEVVTFVGPERM